MYDRRNANAQLASPSSLLAGMTTKEQNDVTQEVIRVLIVNDQEDVCKLWDRYLSTVDDMQSIGYALDGATAISMVENDKPDVILMDVMMPAMDGYETTKRIKHANPDIRIIIYSAYTGKEADAYEAGAHQFLLMPITPDRLTMMIRHVMQQDS
jgi:CheY-like chemotaxis protein